MSEITREFRDKMKHRQTIFRGQAVIDLVEHAEKLEEQKANLLSQGVEMQNKQWALEDHNSRLAQENLSLTGRAAQAENANVLLSGKVAAALKEAVNVIYLNDSSDYLSALWTIVRTLGGQEAADLLENDEQEATRRYCRE